MSFLDLMSSTASCGFGYEVGTEHSFYCLLLVVFLYVLDTIEQQQHSRYLFLA
jgi:hypothetical protein